MIMIKKSTRRCLNTAKSAAAVFALLIVAFLPAKYNNSIYGYFPGLLLVALMAVSFLYLMVLRRSIRFETDAGGISCERGDTIKLTLNITNRSFLTCPKLRAVLFVSDFFGREKDYTPADFSVGGRSGADFLQEIEMNHIGVYTYGVKLLQIYDPLGVFRVSVRGAEASQVTVLPRVSPIDEIYLKDRMLTESRNSSKSATSDGSDYTGVREYALGDSMKRIHWKLSAHSYAYMTKISESSRKNDLTILIDFVQGTYGFGIFPGICDCLVETALSLAEQAIKKDVEYSLLFAGRGTEIVRVIPKGEDDYLNLIQLLPDFSTDCGSEKLGDAGFRKTEGRLEGTELLEQEGLLDNRSANVILCTSNVTEQLVQALIAVRHSQRNPELYYVVPAGSAMGGDEAEASLLALLDDYGILYHLIQAKIEKA